MISVVIQRPFSHNVDRHSFQRCQLLFFFHPCSTSKRVVRSNSMHSTASGLWLALNTISLRDLKELKLSAEVKK